MLVVRLISWIFKLKTFMADMPDVTVTAVAAVCAEWKMNTMLSAVFNLILTRLELPVRISPRSDNLDIWSLQAKACKLQISRLSLLGEILTGSSSLVKDEIEYCRQHGIHLPFSTDCSYSRDRNIWHISHEGLELEIQLMSLTTSIY